jgi:APA family basic amino acid/polyamine antiporter
MVCAGIWVMRVKNPEAVRPFKTPLVPVVPILGAVICLLMIFSLPKETLMAAGAWMIVGLFIYFLYSKANSYLRNNQKSE